MMWCRLFGHRWQRVVPTSGVIGPKKVCSRCGLTSWGHPVHGVR